MEARRHGSARSGAYLEEGWLVYDPASSECELHRLLAAMVAMLKPKLIVETGCHKGYATRALGEACGVGQRVVTCDPTEEYCVITRQRVRGLPVEVRQCRSEELPELERADLVFSDSDYACRPAEIARCKPGAIVVVHDTRISYDSSQAPLEGLVLSLGGVTFDTHRGFGLLRIPEVTS